MSIYQGKEYMDDIQKSVHQIARDSGFYDPDMVKTPLEEVCLWMTECAEAAEEARKGIPLDQVYFTIGVSEAELEKMDPMSETYGALRAISDGRAPDHDHPIWQELVRKGYAKPEGFGIEAADAVIRIMDSLAAKNVSLFDMITLKSMYNQTREPRHGKTK